MASELRVDRIIPVNGVPSGGGGGIIQVVEVTSDTRTDFSSTASSWTATGFSASITPTRSDSKILVMVSTSMYIDTDDNTGGLTVYRNGTTNLGGTQEFGLRPFYLFYGGSTNDFQMPVYMQHLDSPATTSSTSYEVYYKSDKSDNRLNGIRAGRQSIILMEVSG